MKLQLGLLHTDGRPASQGDLAMLLGDIANRRFEVSGEAASGSVLIVYRGNRVTHEEDSEVQPLEQRDHILTWDGRLDNREDFSICFPLTNIKDIPDSAIVLKAYQMFGDRILGKLIGEFALTLWCERTQSLLFVRSACGARPLYYVLDKSKLLWCSHFAHLVKIADVDLTVNDEYVLQYLVTTPDIKKTPLAKIHAIPPNRVVRFEKGAMKCGPELWNPTAVRTLRYRTDHEYEEHCREKITEAVRVRLRSKYPVFSELSGGLDSSAIVLTADQILREKNESPQSLQTVSCVYEESKSADEHSFIRAVEERRAVETHLIHEKDQRITLGLDNPCFSGLLHTVRCCFPGRYQTVSTLMGQYNARVLFTGNGGDHLFWSAPQGETLVADELLRLNLVNAHRQCCIWSRAANIPYYEFLAAKVFGSALGSVFPRRYFGERPDLPMWVHPRHRRTMLTQDADFDGFTNWRASPSKRAQVFVLDRMFRMLGSGFGEDYPQIYVSHPYSHRPLVEACLGMPVSQFLRFGQTRSLMRRALRDLLPQKTANRVSKGLLDETIARALRREWPNISNLSEWQVCQRGYVVQSHLVEALRQVRLGILHLFGPLIRLFSLECWLRSLSPMNASSSTPAEICA